MKVRIAREVLNTSAPDTIASLDAIFLHFRDGRHLWEDLREIEDTEEIKQSGWFDFYSGSRAYDKKCTDLDKLYTERIYSENSEMHCIRLEVSNSADSHLKLKPDEAKRCLDEPLHVFVENAGSDGAFIEAMIHAFGRRELTDAHTEGWWKIEHSGGFGEVEKRVEDVRSRITGIARLFVLTDSDSHYPDHETATVRKIERYCISNDIPFHILEKRTIENYLPVSVLNHVPRQHRKTYQAFLHLTQKQRDYYDMKNGFDETDERGHTIPPEDQKNLFSNVRRQILDDLAGGFGKKSWESFKKYREQITAKDMRMTCDSDPGEIEHILSYIECML